MKFIHDITGTILNWTLNNKYILMTLNILLPVAVYFEAGPVSAFITYFGFYLVISIAMSTAKEERMQDEMGEALKKALTTSLGKGKTTNFETDDYQGSITELKIDELPEEIQEIINKQKDKDKEPTKH